MIHEMHCKPCNRYWWAETHKEHGRTEFTHEQQRYCSECGESGEISDILPIGLFLADGVTV